MTQTAPTADKDATFARYRRRDHANIESLQNSVIAEIARRAHVKYISENPDDENPRGFEMPPDVRHLISALQGVHGGGAVPFEEFSRDYLSIAAQLQFRGSEEARRSRVRARIKALDDWQFSVGAELLHIEPGGKIVTDPATGRAQIYPDGSPVRTKTVIIDYLKPRADEGVQRARLTPDGRLSPLWKEHPGKALEAQVDSVIESLPKLGTRAESGKVKTSKPLPVDVYEQRQEERIKGTIEKVAHEIELKGGDSALFVRKLAREVIKMAGSLAKTENVRHDLIALNRLEREETAATAYMCKSEAESGAAPGEEKLTRVEPKSAEDGEPDMLAWALAWAGQGVSVFPCHTVFDDVCTCPCNKDCTEDKHECGSECPRKGKHPVGSLAPNGVKDATTDEAKIRRWWGKMPHANIGLAMGGPLRLVAVDVDPRSGGSASLADLVEAHGGDWLDTFTQETGSFGNHFIYTLPEGVEVVKGNQKGKLGPGLDTKTEGGYLIGAPSMHASGRRYSVANNTYRLEAPPFLVEFLTAREPRVVIDFQEALDRARSYGVGSGEKWYEGERNDGLFSFGIGRWRHGWAQDATDLHAQLLDANASRCVPPLADSEVAKMAAHIAADYANLRGADEGAA